MRRPTRAHDSTAPESRTPTAVDSLFGGKLEITQPSRGYRVNVDTLILAHFAARVCPRARRAVDLGAGVGALTLAYAQFGALGEADLVEREEPLAALAGTNCQKAGVSARVHALDLESHGLPRPLRGTADLVLSNPPYFAAGAGRTSTSGTRERARRGPLEPFLRAANVALGRRAHAFFSYPAQALPELLAAAGRASLVPKRIRLVHAFESSPARLVLVELRRAKPGGLVIEPPLFEWASRGVRSEELVAITEGKRG